MSTQETHVVPQQLALLTDAQGQSMQSRFEEFCQAAVDALTQIEPKSGEPAIPAGKGRSVMSIEIGLVRLTDDSLTFEFDHKLKVKHPFPKGVRRSAQLVQGVGLAQRVVTAQMPLFPAESGQPTAMTKAEAEKRMAPQRAEAADPDAA